MLTFVVSNVTVHDVATHTQLKTTPLSCITVHDVGTQFKSDTLYSTLSNKTRVLFLQFTRVVFISTRVVFYFDTFLNVC